MRDDQTTTEDRATQPLFIYLFTIQVRVIHTSLNFVHTIKTYLNSHASKNINMVSQRLYILINECNKATAMLQRLTILYMSAIKQRACCRSFTQLIISAMKLYIVNYYYCAMKLYIVNYYYSAMKLYIIIYTSAIKQRPCCRGFTYLSAIKQRWCCRGFT